ncbi:NADH-ubiquinone oxidoreductase B12 subunit family protein [Eremomyces bilateralis CBS 781.70]|uniref:NADH-ubiquinone oxidoreductase B12 subunit family protein n=1 Tax=Eremomyces bilateralis CBS 781.70 TaxID=1392243 RepID=A0A6G1G6L1_9PEZI|nr:NADH-ubiquinone oxidoreductase B12 subunit family protein [Eremomyces bilateralis CBS 781.70]KAF1813520.1 NADH-ubiquinone oxidoreductase B12 subunit family protein [Eremomyces bilateralis CBS 781.70]
MTQKPNISGFDIRKLQAATGRPPYDPWRRVEAWRYTGPFTRANRLKGSFPGLYVGTGAFLIYLAYEQLFLKKDGHGHGSHRSEH